MEGKIIELLGQFFNDPMVRTVIGLVVADLFLGVAVALMLGEYEWKKLLQFYRTNLVPYIIAYAGIYIGVQLVAPELLGEYGDIVSQRTLEAIWAIITYNLVMSIAATLEKLGIITSLKRLVVGVFRRS
jgi:hypothetical protein